MKNRRLILFSALAVLAVAVMIFLFSTQDSDLSGRTSGTVAEFLLRLFHPDLELLSKKMQRALRRQYRFYVRKAGHFSEFLLLGLSLRMLLEGLPVKWKKSVSWVLGALYAVSDEIHQMFVSGRSCQVTDVSIDGAGALAGVFLMTGLIRIFQARKGRKQTENPK